MSNLTPDLFSDVLGLTPSWLTSAVEYGPGHQMGPYGPGSCEGFYHLDWTGMALRAFGQIPGLNALKVLVWKPAGAWPGL